MIAIRDIFSKTDVGANYHSPEAYCGRMIIRPYKLKYINNLPKTTK